MSRSQLERYLREQRRQLEAMEAGVQLQMLEEYEGAIARIQTEIERLVRSGRVIDADRLRYLEYQIDLYLYEWEVVAKRYLGGPLNRRAADLARNDLEEMWRVMRGGERLLLPEVTAGGFVPRMPSVAFEQMVTMFGAESPLQTSLRQYREDMQATIRREMVDAIAQGRGGRAVLQRIEDAATGPYAKSRLESLVRTEMMRGYRAQNDADFEALDIDLGGFVWSASKSKRTCLACLAMDGTFVPEGEEKRSKFHVNCFPAGTVVNGPLANAATKRWYDGDIVEITTAGNQRLAVTPNHPILTTRGWIAAGNIRQGDDVICYLFPEGPAAAINPDYENRPTLIENVAQSLLLDRQGVARVVPGTPMDFHGDGAYGEIDVVLADGFLRDADHAAISEPTLEHELVGRDVRLPLLASDCRGDALLGRGDPAASSLMGGGGKTHSLLRRRVGHTQIHAFGSSANPHSTLLESSLDRITADPHFLREGFQRGASVVPAADIVDIQLHFDRPRANRPSFFGREARPAAGEVLAGGPSLDAMAVEDRADQGAATSVELADLRDRFPGAVTVDYVIDVRRRGFSGHVYNLETVEGWYIANGIVTHNCRCRWLAVPAEGMEAFLAEWEDGETWMRQQSDATLKKMMPNAEAREAFRRGELRLKDFAAERHHPVWGTSVVQDSGRNALEKMRVRRQGWYDDDGKWDPPAPGKSTWRKGMPDEIDAASGIGQDWVYEHSTKKIPADVAELMGVVGDTVPVTSHTLNVMPVGAKHDNARPYFERLEDVLEHTKYIGPSQADYVETDERWELYTPIGNDRFVLTVLGTSTAHPQGEVVSVYVVGMGTMTNRLKKADPITHEPYLVERKKK